MAASCQVTACQVTAAATFVEPHRAGMASQQAGVVLCHIMICTVPARSCRCCSGCKCSRASQDLAVTLRGALSMKTADAFRSVYCWQTVRCLELWARVLTELGPQSVRSPPRPLPTALSGPAVSNSNSNNSPLEPWSLCVSPEVHSEVCRSTDLDGVLHPSTGIPLCPGDSSSWHLTASAQQLLLAAAVLAHICAWADAAAGRFPDDHRMTCSGVSITCTGQNRQ